METIKIKLNGYELHEADHTPVAVEMWYDKHYRHWVIYPVDIEGNQLAEARYGFGKKEAEWIREEIKEEIQNGTLTGLYY